MRVIVGSDHLGYALKEIVKRHLTERGNETIDYGCSADEEVDYPEVATAVAAAIVAGEAPRGILICGTGIGMAIAANKVQGIRAATVTDPYSAVRASASNAAQILCLGSRVVGEGVAPILVDCWLDSDFAGGGSARKIAKISAMEERR